MLRAKAFAVVGLLAVTLAAAPAARAGVNMYQGQWINQSFGNDNTVVTGGAEPESQQWEVVGMPHGHQCNALNPRCVNSQTGARVQTTNALAPTYSTPPLTAKKFDPLAAFCVQATAFGLGPTRPAKGATPTSGGQFSRPIPPVYRHPNHFTAGGNGNATACPGSKTIGGLKATQTKLTTWDPRLGVAQRGEPLSGSGYASTTGGPDPVAFTFPPAPAAPTPQPLSHVRGMRRTITGSFAAEDPYLYSYTYATLRADAGSFFKGGGFFSNGAAVSTLTFPYVVGASVVQNVTVKKAGNFGGTMQLLGQMTTKVCYYRNAGCSLGRNNWYYDLAGTAGGTSLGVLTAPYKNTYTFKYYHTKLAQSSTIQGKGSRFPWTTGTVTVTATGRGPNNTIEKRQGYDNRVNGIGTVQLVTPIITKWLQPAVNFETGGLSILRLKFVPEPASALLLVAGLSLLGVLYRARGR